VDLYVWKLEVIEPHFLLHFWGIGGLAGQADSPGLEAGRVDFQLINQHIMMASRFIIFHTESPAVKEERHIGEFAQFIINDQIGIVALFVFTFPGRLGVFGFEPGLVFQRIGLSPINRVKISIGDSTIDFRQILPNNFWRIEYTRRIGF